MVYVFIKGLITKRGVVCKGSIGRTKDCNSPPRWSTSDCCPTLAAASLTSRYSSHSFTFFFLYCTSYLAFILCLFIIFFTISLIFSKYYKTLRVIVYISIIDQTLVILNHHFGLLRAPDVHFQCNHSWLKASMDR